MTRLFVVHFGEQVAAGARNSIERLFEISVALRLFVRLELCLSRCGLQLPMRGVICSLFAISKAPLSISRKRLVYVGFGCLFLNKLKCELRGACTQAVKAAKSLHITWTQSPSIKASLMLYYVNKNARRFTTDSVCMCWRAAQQRRSKVADTECLPPYCSPPGLIPLNCGSSATSGC